LPTLIAPVLPMNPLPETIEAAVYPHTRGLALARIRDFGPTCLVVCFGLDTNRQVSNTLRMALAISLRIRGFIT
jgi:hypothetical protein